MIRKIIKIDEEKCNGCGACIPNCPEGALAVIDGKARVISDLFCDGLGACIGTCPLGAISIEERNAQMYDEKQVMENIVKGGDNVIKAHLKHLKDHNEDLYYKQAIEVLKDKQLFSVLVDVLKGDGDSGAHNHGHRHGGGCPGSKAMLLNNEPSTDDTAVQSDAKSQLRQWPVQLRLLNPNAPYFDNADLVIAADCVPFAYPNFHNRFLKGKILVVFCPKLDSDLNEYVDKLALILSNHKINSITLVHMEVPCCFGVEKIIRKSLEISGKNIIIKDYTISLKGEII